MKIKYSGRSSDWISPDFINGCKFKCSYCYMRRYNPEGFSYDKESHNEREDKILELIFEHQQSLGSKPEYIQKQEKKDRFQWIQTNPYYWSYDISCNEDYALHAKYHNWQKVFSFFRDNSNIMCTLATKYVNDKLLSFDANKKVRVRFSLMPQELSDILEPNTSKIIDRIKAVNEFYEAGYDVHLNFSPIIINPSSKELYTQLFKDIDKHIHRSIKKDVYAECIMLTHNEKMHEYNLVNDKEAEEILWQPDRQTKKISSYGSSNLRYKVELKQQYIQAFKQLHNKFLSWNTIRYIF